MNRYICIHSHFYQPPRENPWLEEVEAQDSAHPYHDWNERITAECYAPNTESRILDGEQRIVDIVSNYSKISFNFGPTLLSWMEKHNPKVYQAILDADRQSLKRFSGHGAAMAQAYNHMIMPLANERDVRTQVIWGVKDFEHRFKRKPEGMWLSETAVDIKTLEALVEQGIKFTVLAPHQAKLARKIGSKEWKDVAGAKVDPQLPYLCCLPSGRKIHLFFYDGPVSQELAFSDLLKNGQDFAERLLGLFPEKQENGRLVHIATDGETYGHHHRYGDMALSYCLDHIESMKLAHLTVYGEYLAKHPTDYEVEIQEDTSWSCMHGVERWRADCGCCSGGNPGWHQKWRAPLRDALDGLRDQAILIFEKEMNAFTQDPWQMRDDYIKVILDHTEKNVEGFLRKYTQKDLSLQDKVRILRLLEMQRHAMLMYTSCGWFFDEVSGIETTQIIQYASRVIQLVEETVGMDVEGEFIKALSKAPSNIQEMKDAATVYAQYVKPSKIDLLRVGAHYAISSLFEKYPQDVSIYCYTARNEILEYQEAGKQKIVFGRANIRSNITWQQEDISFCVFHFGDHNLNGGVSAHMGEEAFEEMRDEIQSAFLKSDIPAVLHVMNAYFGMHNYSLSHLFKYEQKKIFDIIFRESLGEIEAHYREIYQEYYPSMQARKHLNIPLPKVLENILAFVLSRDVFELLEAEEIDIIKLAKTIEEVRRWAIEIDRPALSYVASQRITGFMEQLLEFPKDIVLLKFLDDFFDALKPLSLDLALGKAQSIFFNIGKQFYKDKKRRAAQLNEEAMQWIKAFDHIGEFFKVKIGI